MNFEEFEKIYALNDGEILEINIDNKSQTLVVKLQVRRNLSNKKLQYCVIKFEFRILIEVNYFDNSPTVSTYSDITMVKIIDQYFYLSLDPFGNSGLPNEKDNMIIKAKEMTLIDENDIRHLLC